MKVFGFIRSVVPSMKDGEQRTYTTKDGKLKECYQALIEFNVTDRGSETVIADFSRDRVEGSSSPYAKYINTEFPLSINLYFEARQYKESYFQSVRLGSVDQKIN